MHTYALPLYFFRNPLFHNFLQHFHHSPCCFSQLLPRVCIRNSNISLSTVSKSSTRSHGYIALLQDILAELIRSHSCLLDVHEHVEGTVRFLAAAARNLVDGFVDEIPSALIFCHHLSGRSIISLKGSHSSSLNEGVGTGNAVKAKPYFFLYSSPTALRMSS